MTDEPVAQTDDQQHRAARFAKLPPRVRPEDTVELIETDDPRAEAVGGDDQWLIRDAAG